LNRMGCEEEHHAVWTAASHVRIVADLMVLVTVNWHNLRMVRMWGLYGRLRVDLELAFSPHYHSM